MSWTRREILLLIAASTLMLAWSSLPIWSGYLAETRDDAFGGTYFDGADHAVHMAMLRYGGQGAWGYELRFTSELHRAAYTRLFYVLLGALNRPLHIPPATLFEVSRWLFGYLALISVYMLARRCFGPEARSWAWVGFSLAVLGSGVGWFQRSSGLLPGPITPMDFWLVDAYILFSLSLFPHFALTLALMCSALNLYWSYLESGGAGRITGVLLASLAVQFINPLAILLIDAGVLAATLARRWKTGAFAPAGPALLMVILLPQLPLLVYNYALFKQDTFWAAFAAQNVTLSPPPVYYFWGFGLLWPMAAAGCVGAWRGRNTGLLICMGWIIASVLLSYSPLPQQRRFLLGITIPLGLLAARGLMDVLYWVAPRLQFFRRRTRSMALAYILLTCLTTLIFFPAHALYMARRPTEYFYPRNLQGAFEWISANTGPDDLILAASRTGQLVAQNTGRRVFLGHEMETIAYPSKEQAVASYLRGHGWRSEASGSPIGWIVYGPYERELSPAFMPGKLLELAFDQNGVSIYRVVGKSMR